MDFEWELLDRYLAGECTDEERARFEAWLAESPVHRQVLQEMRELAAQAGREVPPDRAAELLAGLKRKLPGADPAATSPPLRLVRRAEPRVRTLPFRTPSRWAILGRVAAIMALVVGGASLYLWQGSSEPAVQVAAATRVVTTPAGQRAMFDLPDGSHVILGVASRLEYPTEFGSSRDVQLKGEAYFEVTHDASRPFVVRAGDLVATDLGTEFVVRSYDDEASGRVVVREGKVGLRAAKGRTTTAQSVERVLEPGQLGRLTPDGEVIVEPADLDMHFAWTEGGLVFRRTPLAEAVRQIERWHDVEINLATPDLARRGFTTTFRNGESAGEMLQVIATVLQLDVVPTGRRSYTLRAR